MSKLMSRGLAALIVLTVGGPACSDDAAPGGGDEDVPFEADGVADTSDVATDPGSGPDIPDTNGSDAAPDADADGPDAGPVPRIRTTVAVTAGGGVRESDGWLLRLWVALPQPMAERSSESWRLRLGLPVVTAGPAGNEQEK